MGIPKFFRYLSERYPALSEPAQSWSMPEFDNLYLDMNGIIHNCSHSDKDDVTTRITEEQIFSDVFHYIEFLFELVKPKKVLFLAIDGVAPRAKMNQQRSRRFKTIKEAEQKHSKAMKANVVLPDGECFDPNCITPGTPFMVRLQEQLKYFVVQKVSSDELWKNVKVYLSGHLSPGEGEHKIMDFIRYSKTRPDYDPYTRHCLYGLDADLIMLGLVTHEPFFSLLREEVKYVKTSLQPDKNRPENVNFQLLHLGVLRDYLEIEFDEIKTKYPDRFNIENIIDDWVLMCMLVGNDFIPHLPFYHINKNSLIDLYRAYIEVMPEHGNINELGNLNLERLQIFLSKLAEIEKEKFEENSAEFQVKESDLKKCVANDGDRTETGPRTKSAKTANASAANASAANATPATSNEGEPNEDEFERCKRVYYERKLEFKTSDPDCVKQLAFSYVQALQWNLFYYYDGCQSWSWCYQYHYAPFVSDMAALDDFKQIDLSFEMKAPFLPYEQLLSVMPTGSKRFLPESYQEMMCSPNSPLAGCYPTKFNLDLNGKKQLWEAVCLIPFIDEQKLLEASEIAKRGLTDEQKEHNQHKPQLLFTFSPTQQSTYPSSLPGLFPDITANHAECTELAYTEFHVPVDRLRKGISKKVKLQTHFYGFPSLKFLPFTSKIKNEKIRVFEHVSKGDNVLVKLEDTPDNSYLNLVKYLGKELWYDWPYPKECRLISIFDGNAMHVLKQSRTQTKCVKQQPTVAQCEKYTVQVQQIKDQAMMKRGLLIENETALCFIRPVIGHSIRVNEDGSIGKEKQFATAESQALGKTFMPRLRIAKPKSNLSTRIKAVDLFKVGLKCFPLDKRYYGDSGEILFFNQQTNVAKVRVRPSYEPDLSEIIDFEGDILNEHYLAQPELSAMLDLPPGHLNKILGSFCVTRGRNPAKLNIGLQLKFKEKRECIPNYSICFEEKWFFANEIYHILREYMERFPTATNFIFNADMQSNFVNPAAHTELFPTGNADEQFDELMRFLHDLPTKNERRTSVDNRSLDRCLVHLIEETLSLVRSNERKPVDLSLNVSQIYCDLPVISAKAHPDANAVFKLFDRVVNVKGGFVVPQGLKGIVIALEESSDRLGDTMVTVCFDSKFKGGLRLNTIDARAYTLPQCYLMNISWGKNQSGLSRSQRFGYQASSVAWRQPRKQFIYDQPAGPYVQPGNYWANNGHYANSHPAATVYSYVPNAYNYPPNQYHPVHQGYRQPYQPQRPRNAYYLNPYQQTGAYGGNYQTPYHVPYYQVNHQASYHASHSANHPANQPPRADEQQKPEHLDVWNRLMESANEALKAEQPNPFSHLTFNPTINLIKNPQVASKKKAKGKTVKSIEAVDLVAGDKLDDDEKIQNNQLVKHCEENEVSHEKEKSDPVIEHREEHNEEHNEENEIKLDVNAKESDSAKVNSPESESAICSQAKEVGEEAVVEPTSQLDKQTAEVPETSANESNGQLESCKQTAAVPETPVIESNGQSEPDKKTGEAVETPANEPVGQSEPDKQTAKVAEAPTIEPAGQLNNQTAAPETPAIVASEENKLD